MGDIAPELDNVHPALAACWHPVCRSTDVAEGAVVRIRLLGEDWAVARIDGARRRPRRPLPAPRLAAERRLRRRRHRPLRLPRVPVRAATGTASRSPRSAPAATIPPKADVARCGGGRRALRPGVAGAGAAAGADHRRARVGRPGVRRRPAARPGVARRGGADGRQLPRPRPLPVHPPRHVRRSRRHRGPAVLGRARRAGVHVRLRPLDQAIGRLDGCRRRSRWRRGARRGGTSRRSPSGCASTTRPTTSCSRSCSSTSRSTPRPRSCTASTSATTSPTGAPRSRTRSRSRWPSPRRTACCSSGSCRRPCRSTSRPRCTPAPTGSRSRCAGSCSTSSEPRTLALHA